MVGHGRRVEGALVAYRLGPANRERVTRFAEKVLGQNRRVNGRVYRRRGLLDGIPHWKLSRGVLILRAEDRPRVVRAIRRWTRAVRWWPITLPRSQLRFLRVHSQDF